MLLVHLLILEVIHQMSEVCNRVLSLHIFEHSIRSTLDRHVEERVDPRVGQDGRHFSHVLHDVGRVGHAQSKHAAIGDDLHQLPEKLREGDSNVTTVGSKVLTSQPDLNYSL